MIRKGVESPPPPPLALLSKAKLRPNRGWTILSAQGSWAPGHSSQARGENAAWREKTCPLPRPPRPAIPRILWAQAPKHSQNPQHPSVGLFGAPRLTELISHVRSVLDLFPSSVRPNWDLEKPRNPPTVPQAKT